MQDLSALIGHTVNNLGICQNRRFPAGDIVRIASVIPGMRVMKARYLFFSGCMCANPSYPAGRQPAEHRNKVP